MQLQVDLLQYLHQEYNNGFFAHASSDFLTLKQWKPLEELLLFNDLPKALLPKNIFFDMGKENSGDIMCYDCYHQKLKRLMTFTFNEKGDVTFVIKYIGDKFDAITSTANFAWMINRDAIRLEKERASVKGKTQKELHGIKKRLLKPEAKLRYKQKQNETILNQTKQVVAQSQQEDNETEETAPVLTMNFSKTN